MDNALNSGGASPIPPGGLQITETATSIQLQGQLRLLIAGGLITAAADKLQLPILATVWSLQRDKIAGAAAAAIMFGGMTDPQWARTKLQNSRRWHLAMNPRVPDDLVRPADPKA